MEIYCKTCDKMLGSYPDEKIPLNVRGHTTCKLCGSRIEIFRTAEDDSPKDIPASPVNDSNAPEEPFDNSSATEDKSNGIDEIIKAIPLLSGRKDGGVRKADFIALGTGLLILFAVMFIYKPDFDLSRIVPPGLQEEFEAEMMNDSLGEGDNPVQSLPGMEGLEEVEDAVNVLEEAGKM